MTSTDCYIYGCAEPVTHEERNGSARTRLCQEHAAIRSTIAGKHVRYRKLTEETAS